MTNIILTLQTITKTSQISLYDEKGNILSQKEFPSLGNSKKLLSTIKSILNENIPKKILVVNGKGSYTGTRIGVSIANALAFGWNIPIGKLSTKNYCGDDTTFDLNTMVQNFLKKNLWEKSITPLYSNEPKIG